jgi:hypothetical protein
MSWKTLGVLILTLAFCPSLMAQSEAFHGIWEINLEKTTNYFQQSQMMINLPTPGGGFISTRAQIRQNNESSSTEIHPVGFDEKSYLTTGGDVREITYKLIDSRTIERTHNRDGRISVDREQVSEDGRTMTVTQADRVRIYDKKFNLVAPE